MSLHYLHRLFFPIAIFLCLEGFLLDEKKAILLVIELLAFIEGVFLLLLESAADSELLSFRLVLNACLSCDP